MTPVDVLQLQAATARRVLDAHTNPPADIGRCPWCGAFRTLAYIAPDGPHYHGEHLPYCYMHQIQGTAFRDELDLLWDDKREFHEGGI